MKSENKKNKINFRILFRLLGFFKKSLPFYIIGVLFISSVNLFFNGLAAYSLKGLTDGIVNKDVVVLKNSVLVLSVGILILAISVPIFQYIYKASVIKAIGNLRKALINHIEHLFIKEIQNNHSGDFISRLTNDVQETEKAIDNNMTQFLGATIGGIGSVVGMSIISYKMAIVCIVAGLLSTIVNYKFAEPINVISKKIQESMSKINQNLTDTLAGITILRMFNLNKKCEDKFSESCKETKKLALKLVNLKAIQSSVNNFLGGVGFIGVIVLGVFMYTRGELTLGEVIAITQLWNLTSNFFNSVGTYLTNIQGSIVSCERVFYIIDMDKESSNQSTKHVNYKNNETVVEFENVNFGYTENNNILNDLNFSLNKNETMALVGESGCGKSTVFKLLLRFYKESKGQIKIFGINIEEYGLSELRKLISYVSQDNYLFTGTIAENIGYGKENATMEEIIEAAKVSNAHGFISELTEGYNTEVGERGGNLSGGQRQRISIARAVLKNAPILLLDEATSALDSENELLVQEALEKLMKGKSSIVIAHRLSTVKDAEKILMMENGNLNKVDNYEELLELFSKFEVA